MKRWQGWGNIKTHYPLSDSARAYLKNILGPLPTIQAADLESTLSRVPESDLTQQDLIDTTAETRLRHARGQSLPDWLALSYNRVPIFPDGVAFPEQSSHISELLKFAREKGAEVIPYGGGTSVVGHINPLHKDRPTLTISLERLNKLINFDEESHLAEFGAGITGPDLEASLEKFGFTLGHFPQSFEYSTLGGWIASRSSGQQSYYYGRIEELFAGGEVHTPRGILELPTYPDSAAGPDLRDWVLGSEGRFGIISKAQVRVRPRPQQVVFYGVFFPTWDSG